jgi:hypothetical protein
MHASKSNTHIPPPKSQPPSLVPKFLISQPQQLQHIVIVVLPPRLRRNEAIQNSQIQDVSYRCPSCRIRRRIRYVGLVEAGRPLRSGKEVDLEERAILEPTPLVRGVGEDVFVFEGEVFDDLRFDLGPIAWAVDGASYNYYLEAGVVDKVGWEGRCGDSVRVEWYHLALGIADPSLALET